MNKIKLIIISIICILLFSFSFYYISFNKGINKKDEPVIKNEKDDNKKSEKTQVIDNIETKNDKQEITETKNNNSITNNTNTPKKATNNTKNNNNTSTNKSSTTKKSNTNTTKSTSQNNANKSSSTTQQNNKNNTNNNNNSNSNKNNTSTTTPESPTTPIITYSCPNGYTLNGTKCTTTIDANLVCPDNTTESINNSCINLSEGYETPTEECPSGYILIKIISIGVPDKYNCYPAHSKIYKCDNGYTLSNNKCTKTINATQN